MKVLKGLLLFAAVSVLLSGYQVAGEEISVNLQDSILKVRPAVVKIFNAVAIRSQEGYGAGGSGTMYLREDENDINVYVFTNYHVIHNMASQVQSGLYQVELDDGSSFPGELFNFDMQVEMGVLKLLFYDAIRYYKEYDLGDGKKKLLVFDKDGNRIDTIFINSLEEYENVLLKDFKATHKDDPDYEAALQERKEMLDFYYTTDLRKLHVIFENKDPFDEKKIKRDVHTFCSVNLGDSDKVQPGDFVFAIGSPGDPAMAFTGPLRAFQLKNTVTFGNILALAPPDTMSKIFEDMGVDYATEIRKAVFVHSANINQGNSGGPLFNALGEQIGVNTWGGTYEGGNMSVPINNFKRSFENMLKYGAPRYSWLGIYLRKRTPPVIYIQGAGPNVQASKRSPHYSASRFVEDYYNKKERLIVYEVFPGSPAEEAGFKPGDEIMLVDGKKIDNYYRFWDYVREKQPGDEITFFVKRGGSYLVLKAEIGIEPPQGQGAGQSI